MTLLQAIVTCLALLLAVPAAVLWLQVRLARRTPVPALAGGPRPRLAALVPAHDEADGIAATVQALRAQLQPGDRLLVVADNCRDDTAARAAAAGAQVVQRHDPVRRGKGYALAAGMAALVADAPEVVVIVDADCRPGAQALQALARASTERQAPAQALYRMRAPHAAGLGLRLAAFAWAVRNHLRPLGGGRAGFPCPLFGSGMAFPYPLLAAMPLANGHLVEDLKLGVDLMLAGHAVVFCPQACVESDFPAGAAAQRQQRSRWEHGHLSLLLQAGPRLFAAALRQRRAAPLAMLLDLAVPPLALLLGLQALVAGAALLLAAAGGGAGLWLAAVGPALLAAAVVDAWRQAGRATLSATELLGAPLYALRKVSIYVRWLAGRHAGWVRTARAPAAAAPGTEPPDRSSPR